MCRTESASFRPTYIYIQVKRSTNEQRYVGDSTRVLSMHIQRSFFHFGTVDGTAILWLSYAIFDHVPKSSIEPMPQLFLRINSRICSI
jgi:hypothetical protein